jgi:hypothetical protein
MVERRVMSRPEIDRPESVGAARFQAPLVNVRRLHAIRTGAVRRRPMLHLPRYFTFAKILEAEPHI